MSLVEFTRTGHGQVVKVADTVGGKDVTVFLVDLYTRLPQPPSCNEVLEAQQPSKVRLCYVRAGNCTLVVLISSAGAEIIGGYLVVEGGSPIKADEAREECVRSIGQVSSAPPT